MQIKIPTKGHGNFMMHQHRFTRGFLHTDYHHAQDKNISKKNVNELYDTKFNDVCFYLQ